jgi:thioredoxin
MQSQVIVEGSTENWGREVEQSKLPVLVDFWAAWCGPCRMVSPIVERLAEKHKGKIKVVKLNVDDNPEIAERFSIMSIPTLMLFKNGKAVDSKIGAAPTEVFEEFLSENVAL